MKKAITYFDSLLQEQLTLAFIHGNFAVTIDQFGDRHFMNGSWVRYQVLKSTQAIA